MTNKEINEIIFKEIKNLYKIKNLERSQTGKGFSHFLKVSGKTEGRTWVSCVFNKIENKELLRDVALFIDYNEIVEDIDSGNYNRSMGNLSPFSISLTKREWIEFLASKDVNVCKLMLQLNETCEDSSNADGKKLNNN